jgi:hypothetical protein
MTEMLKTRCQEFELYGGISRDWLVGGVCRVTVDPNVKKGEEKAVIHTSGRVENEYDRVLSRSVESF